MKYTATITLTAFLISTLTPALHAQSLRGTIKLLPPSSLLSEALKATSTSTSSSPHDQGGDTVVPIIPGGLPRNAAASGSSSSVSRETGDGGVIVPVVPAGVPREGGNIQPQPPRSPKTEEGKLEEEGMKKQGSPVVVPVIPMPEDGTIKQQLVVPIIPAPDNGPLKQQVPDEEVNKQFGSPPIIPMPVPNKLVVDEPDKQQEVVPIIPFAAGGGGAGGGR